LLSMISVEPAGIDMGVFFVFKVPKKVVHIPPAITVLHSTMGKMFGGEVGGFVSGFVSGKVPFAQSSLISAV